MTNVKRLSSVAFLGFVLSSCGSAQGAASQSPSTTQRVISPAGQTNSNSFKVPSVRHGSYVKTFSAPSVTANIEYPKLNGTIPASIAGSINVTIVDAVKGYVSDFVSSLGERAGVASSSNGGVSASQISGSVSTELIDQRFASFKFTITTYALGAASPNSEARTLTFDLSNGKQVSLASLFATPNYLSSLSSLSRTELKKRLGQNADLPQITGGTQPYPSNFSHWNLTKNGLEITFSQGRVAAVASGIIGISIPYSKLSQIAKNPGTLTNP